MFFYWQSNGRVDGFTMCILSEAYVTFVVAELKKMNKEEFIGSLKAKVEEKMGRTLVTLMDFNRLSITNTTRWGYPSVCQQ